MEQKLCNNCNKPFNGSEDICNECRSNKLNSDNKMNRLEGAIEALAVLKSYKEIKK